jgi:hypothetical protein
LTETFLDDWARYYGYCCVNLLKDLHKPFFFSL